MSDATPMTAAEVRDALRKRWPDSEYLVIEEAPDSPDRQGRKVDLLAVSLWRSRGYELDAVEIKVSVGDWMREVNDPSKADFWWRHSHRFWVAVPTPIVLQVRQTLPTGWGLLACDRHGPPKVTVKPAKHDAAPLVWQQCIGLMRASANAGVGALARAEQRGYRHGHEVAERAAKNRTGESRLERDLEELRAKVAAFERTAGIDISKAWSEADAGRMGVLFRFLRETGRHPDRVADRLARVAATLDEVGVDLQAVSAEVQRLSNPEEVVA